MYNMCATVSNYWICLPKCSTQVLGLYTGVLIVIIGVVGFQYKCSRMLLYLFIITSVLCIIVWSTSTDYLGIKKHEELLVKYFTEQSTCCLNVQTWRWKKHKALSSVWRLDSALCKNSPCYGESLRSMVEDYYSESTII